MSNTLQLAKELISRDSVTPEDKGCQPLMSKRLEKSGFNVNPLKFGEVDNFWAVHGNTEPVFVFAGHTDVVPVGSNWQTDPFDPVVKTVCCMVEVRLT